MSDFKDPDNESKFTQPKNLGSSKPGMKKEELKDAPVIVKSEKLLSEHDYLFGKKKMMTTKSLMLRALRIFHHLLATLSLPNNPLVVAKKDLLTNLQGDRFLTLTGEQPIILSKRKRSQSNLL